MANSRIDVHGPSAARDTRSLVDTIQERLQLFVIFQVIAERDCRTGVAIRIESPDL
jgi:hypothetical protein